MTSIKADIVLDPQATGNSTGTVNEPSLASSGRRILVAGNWFASRSTDGGASWTFMSPFTEFPSPGADLCCDQVVHYSRTHRLWIWFLQYRPAGSANTVRLAVSRTGASGTWTWWDTTSTDIDATWTDLWFDYPDMAQTDDHLFMSFNLYSVGNDTWTRAVVLRFPLADMTARGALSRQSWSTDQVGSLRFVRGAEDTMWFAGHALDNSAIEVFAWDDDDENVDAFSVPIGAWNEGSYSSQGPDGIEWLARCDGRITAGWIVEGRLGFAWTANADATHSEPYIRVVRIDGVTLDVVDEPDLWSSTAAWAYPSVSPNRRGDLGMTAFTGGPTHPAHMVGSFRETDAQWAMATVATSSHGPARKAWGDYVDIQADPRRKTYWMASGFVLDGGSQRHNVRPHVVTFGP